MHHTMSTHSVSSKTSRVNARIWRRHIWHKHRVCWWGIRENISWWHPSIVSSIGSWIGWWRGILPGAGWRLISWWSIKVWIATFCCQKIQEHSTKWYNARKKSIITQAGSLDHSLPILNSSTVFEMKLEFQLTNPAFIRLGSNLSFNIVGTKNWLLKFNLQQSKWQYEATQSV